MLIQIQNIPISTLFYQEILQEGRQEQSANLVLRLLADLEVWLAQR
ncbi:MAG: hypothetical protein ACO3NK_15955 [Prochlorotrichaceae cyanobacterium]|jgi:hypothetical protein